MRVKIEVEVELDSAIASGQYDTAFKQVAWQCATGRTVDHILALMPLDAPRYVANLDTPARQDAVKTLRNLAEAIRPIIIATDIEHNPGTRICAMIELFKLLPEPAKKAVLEEICKSK